MKKLLAVFLAIASLLCQAACSSDYLSDELSTYDNWTKPSAV